MGISKTIKLVFFSLLVLIIAASFVQVADAKIRKGKVGVFAKNIPKGAFIEGPVFDQKGNLWFVEIGSGHIGRIKPDGSYERFIDLGYEWGPNGMKLDKDGTLIICHRQRGIIRLDPRTKKVETIVADYHGQKFNGPNDLVLDSKGWAYFTDPWGTGLENPTGGVYRVNLTTGEIHQLFDNLAFPNGIQLSEDEKILYIGECNRNRIVKAPLSADGNSVNMANIWTRFSGAGGPDGMSWDVKGNLYMAEWDQGGVYVIDPKGKIIEFIGVPEGTGTTYCVFGGPDNKTLYIFESWGNTIYKVRVAYPGRPQYGETWK